MKIAEDQVWVNKVDYIGVLVLMVDDFRVYYQKDKFIHNRYKHEFIEEFDFVHCQRAIQSCTQKECKKEKIEV